MAKIIIVPDRKSGGYNINSKLIDKKDKNYKNIREAIEVAMGLAKENGDIIEIKDVIGNVIKTGFWQDNRFFLK